MNFMSSRTDRRMKEREMVKQERKAKIKYSLKNRIEEFKLNRQGKTKRKRSDVHSRYRKVDQMLTLFIVIVSILLVIVWLYILFI